MYGTWVTKGFNVHMTPADAQFALAEVETPDDYDGILMHPPPAVPHAIVTSFSPFWDHGRNPAELISRGWYCLTEAYLGDNPNARPDNLNGAANQLGWSTSQPVFGVHNAPLSAYAEWMSWPGADYLGEYVF